ncbi:Retrovirus-related Pol polyprotein from transposon RE1 [Vitis vinifera]|uniref:Retrovirus-related Pol polyprotein from transposon RE1 n=1 Tax=Vitis vinifera TaxID=29760 RepID=A0A438C183_VITVI|nr:Retrovirus-related Pol polyprotein from transposon RE1 [Vitis vinifera]
MTLPPGFCKEEEETKSNDGRMTILIVYVNDIILTRDNTGEVERLKVLATEFEHAWLQAKRYPYQGKKNDGKPMDRERYRQLVGRLIYLSHTRLDIAFAVSVVRQYMHSPKESHLEAMYKILIYLKDSLGRGLFFKKGDSKKVEIYTDADWAGSTEARRSTIGYCTYAWGNLVTWRSKKQSVVARSSAEAEFRVVAQGMCEGLWLQKLLKELHITIKLPIKLYCDNKVVI